MITPPEAGLVQVRIEVPRGGFVKWGADGGVDFVSPLPCPFNYGSLPGPLADDGDPPDAVLLGPRRARGSVVRGRVVGRALFLDQGRRDDKLLCVPEGRDGGLSHAERLQLVAFFALYARVKALAGRLGGARGRSSGQTRFEGLDDGCAAGGGGGRSRARESRGAGAR
ncbi:inorganic diphosphatase [Myxococcota bacterium]|nr:inorganic diphosphatase [Myxococcota bacterium]